MPNKLHTSTYYQCKYISLPMSLIVCMQWKSQSGSVSAMACSRALVCPSSIITASILRDVSTWKYSASINKCDIIRSNILKWHRKQKRHVCWSYTPQNVGWSCTLDVKHTNNNIWNFNHFPLKTNTL